MLGLVTCGHVLIRRVRCLIVFAERVERTRAAVSTPSIGRCLVAAALREHCRINGSALATASLRKHVQLEHSRLRTFALSAIEDISAKAILLMLRLSCARRFMSCSECKMARS